ncbi:MAG: DUF4350 domain-containing protein [Flavobacteriales bacterium]
MTRKEKIIAAMIALLIVLIAVLEALAPKPTDWSASYSRYHDKPFGAELLYERLGDLFDRIVPVQESIYEVSERRWYEDTAVSHLYLNQRFAPEAVDLERLLGMVRAGDQAFIAAEDFGPELSDSLGIGTSSDWKSWNDTTRLAFQRGLASDTMFAFPRMGNASYFNDFDTASTTVLCTTNDTNATMLHMRFGSGHFYLCTTPLAFTNYHLLRDANNDFIEAAFARLPRNELYWDEFHKVGREGRMTPLRYIIDQPPLRWAYYIALLLVLLYMFVQAKREQRAMPILEPLRNSSREFVGTLGRLYYEKGDHADLARKMIAHFKEDVRNRAYLRGFEYDERTAAHIARRTGMTQDEVANELNAIHDVELLNTISETQLLELSDRLQSLRKRL